MFEVKKEEKAEDLKMNILQAIHYIIESWDKVNVNTIQNYPVLNDIADALDAFDFFDTMQLVEMFKINNSIVTDLENADDSFEISVVSADMTNASLETIHTFLLQENDTKEYINIL
ncbi:5254_t:CDS:2 [Cetraspora pellucida]|uniref:5254_t:CDS:1 n=1 Tax=Cetraspora pellucida TaxID=1433469 RepID=A0ACA9MM01_9GLOM|nr:5254_t:CDS:2 [Cetraspora pellucida]